MRIETSEVSKTSEVYLVKYRDHLAGSALTALTLKLEPASSTAFLVPSSSNLPATLNFASFLETST